MKMAFKLDNGYRIEEFEVFAKSLGDCEEIVNGISEEGPPLGMLFTYS
jgi:hypothetical protein